MASRLKVDNNYVGLGSSRYHGIEELYLLGYNV
jgi:hypothetical protein